MSPRPDTFLPGFAPLVAAMRSQPLHEAGPSAPGSEPAATGFVLGLAAAWAGKPGVIWAGEDGLFAEEGAPYPPGLVQFGIDLSKLIVIRARKRDEALWAAEQALGATGAVVICALAASRKPLDLKATRRLLLFAEKNGSRCILMRPPAEASAAWTRWRVSPAPSNGDPELIGQPAYRVELTRNRAGPSGASFILDWNADARSFAERALARDRSAAPEYGPADPIRASA